MPTQGTPKRKRSVTPIGDDEIDLAEEDECADLDLQMEREGVGEAAVFELHVVGHSDEDDEGGNIRVQDDDDDDASDDDDEADPLLLAGNGEQISMAELQSLNYGQSTRYIEVHLSSKLWFDLDRQFSKIKGLLLTCMKSGLFSTLNPRAHLDARQSVSFPHLQHVRQVASNDFRFRLGLHLGIDLGQPSEADFARTGHGVLVLFQRLS